MEKKRNCPVCGDTIIGRIDKKFCSDQCRNEFNNKLNRDSNRYIRRINYTLRKNRRILEELNPGGKTKISRYKLVNKGFDFRYFTNIYRTKTGNTYYFCYEQGYLPLENESYILVMKDDHDPNILAPTLPEYQKTGQDKDNSFPAPADLCLRT